ncbi:MAG: DUF2235 domain-containing protein [Sphingomonas adhaesiva]|uniref:DUF2235 domain-containing protein n=1 Tax=Sphingomonas adhaesiva TaxID=28212 RepID=UPI002FF6AB67
MVDGEGPAARNLVAMCDGTGNHVEGDLSNVLKLFRVTVRDERQRVFYDPGVGTIARDSAWSRLKQRSAAVFGLVTGAGLDDNILDAYRFLCLSYQPGDRIFLFGFSRGAYTVRALAGLIHMVGLLPPDQVGLAEQALNAYKHSAERNDLHVAWDFSRILGGRPVRIHFVGVWDTVASMIVPRRDRMYLPSLRTLPYTRRNPSVRAFRHAMAIDERRRMFRLNRWVEPQRYVEDPFGSGADGVPQDVAQRWFPGVHSDIGGGYPEPESALSKGPLLWMAEEARAHGLLIDGHLLDRLGRGMHQDEGRYRYVAPDPAGPIHRSLRGVWWLLEVVPKSRRRREMGERGWGLYFPLGERRRVPPGAVVDQSARDRMAALADYRPEGIEARVDATGPEAAA